MKNRMQRVLGIILPGIVAFLAGLVPSPAPGQMSDYCSVPPFLSNTVQPNVLIVLDNSGSMNGQAYVTKFNPLQFVSKQYYGYFDSTKMYRYQSMRWVPTTDAPATATAASPIASGNILNWATMTRIEAAKKLLIGGKANPRSMTSGCCVKLTAETTSDNFIKTYANTGASLTANAAALIAPYDNFIYPFLGNFSYRRSGDQLTIAYSGTTPDVIVPAASDLYGITQWSVVGGTGGYFGAINENPTTVTHDGDTSYIKNTVNLTAAIFGYDPLPTAGGATITSVTVNVIAKRVYTSTTYRNMTFDVRGMLRMPNSSGVPTLYPSSVSGLAKVAGYNSYAFDFPVNPATNLPWTWEDIQGGASTLSANYIEGFGVQQQTFPTANLYMQVTKVYLRINATAPSGTYNITVDTGTGEIKGIIDDLGDDARFGLAYYNDGASQVDTNVGTSNRGDGGRVETYIGFSTPTDMITSIGNLTPSTWTPLAETLYEMIRYFRQETPAYTGNSPADYQTGPNYDPYWFRYSQLAGSGLPDQFVPCAKSFILFLTDGESTKDKNIPATLKDYDNDGNDAGAIVYGSQGSDYMDDVALWGRTVDHRPTLSGNQNIILYPVYMFGQGSELLKDAAVNGGFNDLNGDNKPGPDIREYLRDSNKDGAITNADLPLTYYEGDDGYALQDSITQAIADIMKRAASGTAVSVLTTSSRGVGSIVQAYFLPVRQEGMREITWTGYAQNIWLDPFDNLREDTVNDLALKLADDNVLKLYYDANINETMAATFTTDAAGNSDPLTLGSLSSCQPAETKKFSEVTALWESGKKLALRRPSSRTMFTAKKAIYGATTHTLSSNDFTVTNVTTDALLRAALNPDATYSVENIVRYIRGECLETGVTEDTACGATANTIFRDRRLAVTGGSTNGNVWKLGDIINSTPKIGGNMALNYYHIDYGDGTYFNFVTSDAYKQRMSIAVLGANDGMLHAIKLGYLKDTNDGIGNLASNVKALFKNLFSDSDSTNDQVGEEAWSYIPFNAFPYLKYLANPDYCHIYYSDLTTRIVDVSIGGSADTPTSIKSKDSWRSVLIGGMNFGGACSGGMSPTGPPAGTPLSVGFSAYFAIDVTDPANPVPLWEFSDPDMGYATTFPSIIRTGAADQNGHWYVAFGSGSKQLPNAGTDIGRNSPGQVFIVDVKTGQLVKKISLGADNAIVGDIIAVDADLNYSVENLYFGTSYMTTSWQGKLMNIAIPDQDLASVSSPWTPQVTTLFTGSYPFTASPDATLDDKGNVWVYIGSGKFNSNVDKTDTSQQIFLAIKHASGIAYPLTVASLHDRTDVQTTGSVLGTRQECMFDSTTNAFGTKTIVTSINPTSTPPPSLPTDKGWYLRLSTTDGSAERVISRPLAVGGLVDFVTYKPNADPCAGGGDSFLYAVSYLTGVAPSNVAIISPDVTGGVSSGNVTVKKGVRLGAGAPPKGEAISLTPPKEGKEQELKKKIQVGTGVIIETANEAPLSMVPKFLHWLKK